MKVTLEQLKKYYRLAQESDHLLKQVRELYRDLSEFYKEFAGATGEPAPYEETKELREYTESLVMNASLAAASAKLATELAECVNHNLGWLQDSDLNLLDEEGRAYLKEVLPPDPMEEFFKKMAQLEGTSDSEAGMIEGMDDEPVVDLASFDPNKIPSKLN